jgi:hypothetical protein
MLRRSHRTTLQVRRTDLSSDLRNHKVLRTASFVRRNMQGIGLLASEY